jgi:hypothetical protein
VFEHLWACDQIYVILLGGNHVVPLFYGKLRKIPVLRSGPRVHLRREEFEPRRREQRYWPLSSGLLLDFKAT